MGIEIEEPIREAFVCDTLFKNIITPISMNLKNGIPLTHESLTVIWVITRKPLIKEKHLLRTFICVAPVQTFGHNIVECHVHVCYFASKEILSMTFRRVYLCVHLANEKEK